MTRTVSNGHSPPARGAFDRIARVLSRVPGLPLRRYRRLMLRSAYRRGLAAREVTEEPPDPKILSAGAALRTRVMDGYRDKYSTAGFRVLMLCPGSITAEIWFGGLHQCMRHSGIDCHVLPPSATTARINASIEELKPNVLIATDSTATLETLDLEFLQAHKRRHGCLRLFVPVWHSGMPGSDSTPREDAWRRDLRRRGLTADAYFSIFEPEFYERFVRDRSGPPIDFLTVPQGCNPFSEYPRPEPKIHDYFMATSLTDERLDVTYKYVRPFMSRYRGLWAGPRWTFGLEQIAPAEMPAYYARTRVALSPLAGFVPIYAAELTHRVYAAAGCGTFQLTMPTAITGRYFEPDELIQAKSAKQFAQLFVHFVDRAADRNAIALRALERTYTEHTCFHRVEKLVTYWRDLQRRGFY